MELKIEGLSILGAMKVFDTFVDEITYIRAERNPKNNETEFTIIIGIADKYVILPEEDRIEIVDWNDSSKFILYSFQFQRFIIQ